MTYACFCSVRILSFRREHTKVPVIIEPIINPQHYSTREMSAPFCSTLCDLKTHRKRQNKQSSAPAGCKRWLCLQTESKSGHRHPAWWVPRLGGLMVLICFDMCVSKFARLESTGCSWFKGNGLRHFARTSIVTYFLANSKARFPKTCGFKVQGPHEACTTRTKRIEPTWGPRHGSSGESRFHLKRRNFCKLSVPSRIIRRPQGTRGSGGERTREAISWSGRTRIFAWRPRRGKNKQEARGKADERRKPAARASKIVKKKASRKTQKQTKEEKLAR